MPSASDPLDQAFPESSAAPAVDTSDPIEQAFAHHVAEPAVTYDAAEFRRRTGRDPSGPELADFAATKGANYPVDRSLSPVGTVIDKTAGGAVRGVVGGYKGLATLASGGGPDAAAKDVNAVTSQEGTGSPATAAALESPYNPLNYADVAGRYAGDKLADAGAPPWVSTTVRMIPDVAMSVLGFRGGRPGATADSATEAAATSNAPHPLQGVADAETARMRASVQAGREAGIDLPERTLSPNQQGANAIVQRDLNLPPNSPITPAVLDAARQKFGAPAYEAVSKVPEVKLGSAYEDAIGNVDTSLIKEGFRPPTGGSLSGDRAVELSKYLREKATDYFQEGTVEGNEKGQAHWDAAQAVEDAVERRLKATGQGKLSADWDNARTYYAKTYSVQSALDGAGNVVAPKLKTQLIKGKPLSGGLQDLATMAATNPEAFKATPMAPPRPGVIRRGAAAVIPPIATLGGSLAGGLVGHPSAGAVLGENAGVRIANRVLSP